MKKLAPPNPEIVLLTIAGPNQLHAGVISLLPPPIFFFFFAVCKVQNLSLRSHTLFSLLLFASSLSVWFRLTLIFLTALPVLLPSRVAGTEWNWVCLISGLVINRCFVSFWPLSFLFSKASNACIWRNKFQQSSFYCTINHNNIATFGPGQIFFRLYDTTTISKSKARICNSQIGWDTLAKQRTSFLNAFET